MQTPEIRLGVVGLGRAFTLMLPTFVLHPEVRLVGGVDPRAEAREQFARDFGTKVFVSVEELCQLDDVEAVYISSPHQFHVEHVRVAARAGKHILVEKPMALTLADCEAMISAVDEANVQLVVGHSHSFDLPYVATRDLIDTGQFGRVRMITALNFTDYLYRPRRPAELTTAEGGGAVFSQAPHQVEIVRLLAGSPPSTIHASTGVWDPERPTEGAYSAHLNFNEGVSATLVYNGYGHYDTDALNCWIGEMGEQRAADRYGEARRLLTSVSGRAQEAELKGKRTYGPQFCAKDILSRTAPIGYNHFGFILASCEKGDLRPTPLGVEIYADRARDFIPLPPVEVPRREVIDELAAAVRRGVPPVHSGRWARATLEVCLAIIESARTCNEVALRHQDI